MKELVVVAAPSCAGKSTVIDALMQGLLPELCETLGMVSPAQWHQVPAVEIPALDVHAIERMLVHYDLFAHYRQGHFKHLPDLIDRFDKVTVLTLNASPEVLAQRNNHRLLTALKALLNPLKRKEGGFIKAVRKVIRLRKKQRAYQNDYSTRLYSEWSTFLGQLKQANHLIMHCDTQGVTRVRPERVMLAG